MTRDRYVPVALRLFALVFGLFAVGLFGASGGCDDGPNTQRLPIGQRCAEDSVCGTSPYACETTGYPGGYCDKTCATDADCPSDSVCYVTKCRRKCTGATECRQAEGYTCRTTGATAPYCDVP